MRRRSKSPRRRWCYPGAGKSQGQCSQVAVLTAPKPNAVPITQNRRFDPGFVDERPVQALEVGQEEPAVGLLDDDGVSPGHGWVGVRNRAVVPPPHQDRGPPKRITATCAVAGVYVNQIPPGPFPAGCRNGSDGRPVGIVGALWVRRRGHETGPGRQFVRATLQGRTKPQAGQGWVSRVRRTKWTPAHPAPIPLPPRSRALAPSAGLSGEEFGPRRGSNSAPVSLAAAAGSYTLPPRAGGA
jgi:hypothetical protein